MKVVLRALGFDPTKDDIEKLKEDIGKSNKQKDQEKIDFQEFLEIMILKMSQKDSIDDIDKAYKLFCDSRTNTITKESLKKVVVDLEEDMTD